MGIYNHALQEAKILSRELRNLTKIAGYRFKQKTSLF